MRYVDRAPSRRFIPALIVAGIFGASCAGTDQEVQSLRAFTKLYGYVKYFHPSDEAYEVPWDKFAVHGAQRVKGASSVQELKAVLEELFKPIAPTVQIYISADGPPAPLVRSLDDTTGLVLVAWQHRGVSYGTNTPTSTYHSIRLNRRNPVPSRAQGAGNVLQSVDATPYRGRGVRLRAFVRADVSGSGNQGQLWMRVDREGGQRGFFDNMVDRPIRSNDWNAYEILGDVADDATQIVFGCFLLGAGTLWIDDFELHADDPSGEWTSVEIPNGGLEEVDESGNPEHWFARSSGYRYELDTSSPHSGARSLVIQNAADETEWFTGQLFEEHPVVGEVVNKEIGAGLSAQIPLALFSDSSGTLGDPDAEALAALTSALDAIDIATLSADDQSVRLGDVVITWNVFQHFYPYFDVVETDWDTELTRALEGALEDESARDFHFTLNRLVAALHDGHGRVFHPTFSAGAGLPLLVDWVEGQVVVSVTTEGGDPLPGDVVVTIDGVPAERALLDAEQYISGSPQWMRVRALREFGSGQEGTDAVLMIQRGDSTFEARVSRVAAGDRPSERTGQTIREIDTGVFYVDLDRAEMPEISEWLDRLANARGVVFDLRGYPRGNHQVISHLLQVRDTSDRWMQVPQIVYPDQEHMVGVVHHGWMLPTAEPRIMGEVVFLTDGRAISYAESFMSFIERYRLAEIVGQPTAGANGNVNPFELPGGFRVTWTGMKVVKHDGSQHHVIGIHPTIPAERTIQGIREGRDELLEKALEVINERSTPTP